MADVRHTKDIGKIVYSVCIVHLDYALLKCKWVVIVLIITLKLPGIYHTKDAIPAASIILKRNYTPYRYHKSLYGYRTCSSIFP